MTQTVAQFAERCLKAGAAMNITEREMVRAAALVVTTAVRGEISAATNGTKRLSGVGARGASVGAGFFFLPRTHPTAMVKARGPLHLLERGTKPHEIVPKRKRALSTPNGAFGSVQSPGTAGKGTWTKGIATGLPLAEVAAVAAARKTVVKAMVG